MEIISQRATFLLLFLVSSSTILPSFSSALCVPRNTTTTTTTTTAAFAPSLAYSPAPLPSAGAPAPSGSGSDSSALKLICDKTDHPVECMSSVVPFLSGQVDPLSVFKAELQALNKGFKDGISMINTLYYGADADVQSTLDVCLDVYQSGDSDYSDAVTALTNGDIATLRIVVSAAVGYPDTCEDAFDESGMDNPLQENDDLLGTLASNCLAIAELLPSV